MILKSKSKYAEDHFETLFMQFMRIFIKIMKYYAPYLWQFCKL